jgi:hypothetical protein
LFLERFRAKLQSALEQAGRTHTIEDVRYLIATNRLQVWVKGDSLLLTEIAEFPSSSALHHFAAVGRIDDLWDLRDQAINFAKDRGCTREIVTGRPGWVRVLRRRFQNWNEPQIQMVRELT